MTPISEDHAILSDGRDLDPGEREALESSRVTHYRDVAALTGSVLPNRSLWVHFDTDVVDAKDSPAMNYPVSGGPSTTELRKVFENISNTGRIAAVSLSAWNPALPGADTSREVSMSLLGELINP
jgi:arginase